jgi:thioredoxin reductase
VWWSRNGTPPAELRRIAHEQLRPYTTVTVEPDIALTARPEGEGFAVTTGSGVTHHARALLLATSVRDELPPIPGLAERWGRQVLHCPYCHGWEMRERRLAVLANAPWAAEYALTIRGWGDDLTLLTDGPAALGDEERQRLARHWVAVDERPLAALSDGPEGLLRVQFAGGAADDYAAVFHRPRQHQASDLAQQLGCALDAPIPGQRADPRRRDGPDHRDRDICRRRRHDPDAAGARRRQRGYGRRQRDQPRAPAERLRVG